MDIRLKQLNPTIGDIKGNTALILEALRTAENDGMDLLILTELCVCGYSPMDLLERPAFRKQIEAANQKIIAQTKETALIFGSITENDVQNGRPCFNTAIVARHGKKVGQTHKCLLPTYDVFDELRYFEPGETVECIPFDEVQLGITICEDIWANNSDTQYHTYKTTPVKVLIEKGADCIINLSASPFTVTKSAEREKLLTDHVRNTGLPVFYANQVGANAELISDGDSMVLNANGDIVARAPLFREATIDVNWDGKNIKARDTAPIPPLPHKEARILEVLQWGLRDYIKKTGVTTKVVLGLSGGIDSTVVACIAAEALGPENVMGVAMPSEFSSKSSLTDAQKLAENLNIELYELPIKKIYGKYMDVLEPLFKDTAFGVAEENIQSRARGMLLMAIANKFNRFVLNTGNKSELATGYCTLYGDMNGALAVISDLYKTEVFALAEWLNRSFYKKEIIPRSVIDKPPSAELRPDQKDSDSLPAYDKLDTILKLYLEEQISAARIAEQGFDKQLVEKIIQLVNKNEHKRFQAPPGLKIHDKSFGTGRRWPLVQQWSNTNV
jgi:NAD+ synthetase